MRNQVKSKAYRQIKYSSQETLEAFPAKKKFSLGNFGMLILLAATLSLAVTYVYVQGNFSEMTYKISLKEREKAATIERIKAFEIQKDALEEACYIYKKAEQFLSMKTPSEEQIVYVKADAGALSTFQTAKTGEKGWSKFFLGLSKNPTYLGMRN